MNERLTAVPGGSPPSSMHWRWAGGSRVASGPRGHGPVTSGAVREAGGRFGAASAAALDGATTNLVPNPSFEVDTAGWIPFGGGASLARVAGSLASAAGGAWSCEVTASAAIEGIQSSSPITGIAAATTYTVSAHLDVPPGASVQLQWNEYDSGGGYLGIAHSAVVTGAAGTQRAAVTATTHASCAMIALYAYTLGSAATFRVDGCQLEATSAATAYCDGSLGAGYAWTSTAHLSSSTRASASMRIGTGGCSAAHGSLAIWWRPAAASSANGDRPLLRWGAGASYLEVAYCDGGDRFRLTSQVAGAGADAVESAAQPFAADEDVLVVAAWDERTLRIAVGESGTASAGRAGGVPAIADAFLDIGADGAGAYAGGAIGPVVWFDRVLTPAEVIVLSRLARAPRWQEVA